MFHIFHFCNVKCFWELQIPFSEYLMQSPLRKIAWFQCLSYQLTLTWGQWIFSRLLNPDWSIQISRAPAVCKVETAEKTFFHSWLSYADVCSEDWTKLFDHCDCQVTHFFPQANQDDINFRNNSDRNSLGHSWVPLRIHVILRTLASERKRIYHPGFFYGAVSCLQCTWNDIGGSYMNPTYSEMPLRTLANVLLFIFTV